LVKILRTIENKKREKMTEYIKTVANETNTQITVNLHIRLGEQEVRDNYDKIEIKLEKGKKADVVLPTEGNKGKMPFLNSLDVLSEDYKYLDMAVKNKGDETDNLLNTNKTITIINLSGEKIGIKGTN
jgi:hypothetical protein